jgi:hypothetical protein
MDVSSGCEKRGEVTFAALWISGIGSGYTASAEDQASKLTKSCVMNNMQSSSCPRQLLDVFPAHL